MNARAVHRYSLDLYDGITDMFPGEWTIGGRDWNVCRCAGHDDGVQFTLFSQRLDQEIGEPGATAARRVREAWVEKGIAASLAVDDGRSPANHYVSYPRFLSGPDPDGLLIGFTASDDGYMDFSITTACVPGDVAALNDSE